MFNADSYFVRPPQVLSPEQKILLQATAYCLTAAFSAATRIVDITTTHVADTKNDDYSAEELLALYQCCWSLVDETHLGRVCLRLLDKKGESPHVKEFLDTYPSVKNMRDMRDHIKDNIGNWGAAKKKRTSILGQLGYVRSLGPSRTLDGKNVMPVRTVILPFGVITHDEHAYDAVNPAGKEVLEAPCHFEFSAFDDALDISALLRDLPALAEKIDEGLTKALNSDFEQISREKGIAVADLKSQTVGFKNIAIDGFLEK